MTDTTALVLGAAISALLLADWFLNGAGALTFLGRQMIGLIAQIAFWR